MTTNTTKRLAVGMRVLAPGAAEGTVVEVHETMACIDWTKNPRDIWVPRSIATAPGWVVL